MHPAVARGRTRAWPPREVREVTGMFCALADEAAPGLLEGLYLRGSIGFGEWYAGRSDIDFVAVLAERPDEQVVDLLRDVHGRVAQTFPWPPYDGLHLTWEDLARSPYDCPDVPCTQAGSFDTAGRLDLHPVTWHELARHALTVRGPDPAGVPIWTDQRVLRASTHANLRDAWAPEVQQLRRFPAEAARPEQLAWFVLGTSRLHHLLATDRLTSKSGAGRYAIEAFGERWSGLVSEALAIRATGEPLGSYDPGALSVDVVAFTDLVISTGLELGV